MVKVERHHWLNTFIGILDAAFNLTEEEQAAVIAILRELLVALQIPERGSPVELPAALALEVSSEFFTISLSGPRESRLQRSVRAATETDTVVSPDAWRDSLAGMLMVAYPDLIPAERLLAHNVFSKILLGIGVPHRAPEYLPGDVIRSHLSISDPN
jgi:hypothetical protein